MGVHPNGPSKLVSDGKLLLEKIAESKFFLGDHEGGSLQFLFKVLSVNKALSVQSYPDKSTFPELRNLITSKNAIEDLKTGNDFEKSKIFSEYMRSSNKNAVQQLAIHLKNKNDRSSLEELLLRLNSEYPGDIGAPLLMNYFTLKKGDTVFVEPNSPHAYLWGDNTVRAGLTPEFKDVDTLCLDLIFEMIQPLKRKFLPKNY
uniref:Phosphohexomutase n=1 Tax=Wuchereria bancrofti TaxID=6293 RepID=A0AAF5Q7H4_WUCBA